MGPARIAYRLRMHPSTVHKVLCRYRLARLAWLDRATGRVVRGPGGPGGPGGARASIHRYEHAAPGDLVHVDIKKLGRIPDGGGHRVLGRAVGATNGGGHRRGKGYAFIHTAIDDHSRLAYAEILTDEKKETAAGFWTRAHAYFDDCGITVHRVLTDNGSCYRSKLFAGTLGQTIKHKRTRPYRPQTNGKVERFNRTLLVEWAYRQAFTTNQQRAAGLAPWLEHYNTQRRHSALAGLPPTSRLPPT